MSSDEITSVVKEIVVPSTFPKERGGEKAYSARRGFRIVIWYVFLETGNIASVGNILHVLRQSWDPSGPKIRVRYKPAPCGEYIIPPPLKVVMMVAWVIWQAPLRLLMNKLLWVLHLLAI